MREQIIHLDAHDDITSLLDKLGWVRAERILLNFPQKDGGSIIRSRLDLVLIEREADRRHVQVCLISASLAIHELAEEYGMPCFDTIDKARKHSWSSAKNKVRAFSRDYRDSALSPELANAATRLQSTHNLEMPPAMQRLAKQIVVSLSGFFSLSLLIFGLPGATVRLSPVRNVVAVEATIIADPGLDVPGADGLSIPARIVGVKVEAFATVEATGSVDVPSTKAAGVVVFSNLSSTQLTIPAGTVVRTSAAKPVRFATKNDATLPGSIGATIEIEVEAVESGYSGNLPAGQINAIEGPYAAQLAVVNLTPTQGGSSKSIKGISQEDRDRVRTLVIQQLQQRALAEMEVDPDIRLLDTEFIPPESLRIVIIDSETYDGVVGEAAESVALTMRATVQGTAIDERPARQVVYSQLVHKMGSGFEVDPDGLIYNRENIISIDPQRRIIFSMSASGEVKAAIDRDAVRRLIIGHSAKDVGRILSDSFPLAIPPSVETWPPIMPILPLNPARIDVIIE